MRRILILASAVSLAGCANTLDRASSYVCRHPAAVIAGARATILASPHIADPVARQAAIDAANLLIAAAQSCPMDRDAG